MPGFDPSKMDPKVMMELSKLVAQLPPEKLNQMQSLMHNAMAGFDVRAQMEEFEKTLPPGFREKIASLMVGQTPEIHEPSPSIDPANMDIREARLTILRGVSEGRINPEEAEKLLFNS